MKMEIDDWEKEGRLIYSLIVAGKSAIFTDNVMKKLCNLGLRNNKNSPFETLKEWVENKVLEKNLRLAKTGNYRKLTRGLTELTQANLNLNTCSVDELEKIHGIGPKSSRFFIMWIRETEKYAALDVHVLRWLKNKGHEVPKSTPNGKKYREIEEIFLKEAEKLNLSPRELDKIIWEEGSKYVDQTANIK